ncbi:DUF262 domain-containing protein [Arthrobacter silvisoli]|uniref:DUF262 domain-containing protein n=1 Tax=Arthrobacter silvisoli TaxID=2291022 RepID=UPI000E214AC5|nr:DUF262 domain-containing protein [Arthrobacter silvisoli]
MADSQKSETLSLDVDESDVAKDVRTDATVTWSTDWTVETLVGQLQRGRFDLEPAFQRRDVWSDIKRSRFIESLLLGIPIPQIILAEQKNSRGKFIVLDGKQRLRSLQIFAGIDSNPMKLSGLQILTHLNGITFEDMRSNPNLDVHAAALENQVIRSVVLRDWENEALLYLTFLRLNSNVVGLSPQELRRALHPGPFMNFIMECSAESAAIRSFLGGKGPDFRMRDAEMLIRHIALSMRMHEYRGNLRTFLDETCEFLNRHWASHEIQVRQLATGLDQGIDLTFHVFGKNAFKRFTKRGYESRRNRAVLDIMAFHFQDGRFVDLAYSRPAEVRHLFETLCLNNEEFSLSLTATTKSIEAVRTRFSAWGMALDQLMTASGE